MFFIPLLSPPPGGVCDNQVASDLLCSIDGLELLTLLCCERSGTSPALAPKLYFEILLVQKS